jgi:hypothetical protein
MCTRFWWESPKERDHSEDRDTGGTEWTLQRLVGGGGVEWIQLVQDKDQWQALVNTVMNLQVLVPRS